MGESAMRRGIRTRSLHQGAPRDACDDDRYYNGGDETRAVKNPLRRGALAPGRVVHARQENRGRELHGSAVIAQRPSRSLHQRQRHLLGRTPTEDFFGHAQGDVAHLRVGVARPDQERFERAFTLETRAKLAMGSSARIIKVPNWKPVRAKATMQTSPIPAPR